MLFAKPKTPDWFEAELAQAQAALYSYACAMLGGSADAWDVVQNANKVMLDKASEVQNPQDVMPWGFTVVRFEVMAHRKKALRDRHIFNLSVLEKIAEHAASQSIDFQERVVALEACLKKLPERQRECLALRYDEDLSVRDVARRLHRTENAVAIVLCRARLALAQCIAGRLAEGDTT